MNYDGAVGYLVGEEHQGLKTMFIMMNAARLGVAVQGLSQAEAAYQNALAYCQDRLRPTVRTACKAAPCAVRNFPTNRPIRSSSMPMSGGC